MSSRWTNSTISQSLSLSLSPPLSLSLSLSRAQRTAHTHTHAHTRTHRQALADIPTHTLALPPLLLYHCITPMSLASSCCWEPRAHWLTDCLTDCSPSGPLFPQTPTDPPADIRRRIAGDRMPFSDGEPAAVPVWERRVRSSCTGRQHRHGCSSVFNRWNNHLLDPLIHWSHWLLRGRKKNEETARTGDTGTMIRSCTGVHGGYLWRIESRRRKGRTNNKGKGSWSFLLVQYTLTNPINLLIHWLVTVCFAHRRRRDHDPDLLESYIRRLEKKRRIKATKRRLLFVFYCWINTSIDPSELTGLCREEEGKAELVKLDAGAHRRRPGTWSGSSRISASRWRLRQAVDPGEAEEEAVGWWPDPRWVGYRCRSPEPRTGPRRACRESPPTSKGMSGAAETTCSVKSEGWKKSLISNLKVHIFTLQEKIRWYPWSVF